MPIGLRQMLQATRVMPLKHCVPASIEQRFTHDKNIDIAIVRKATWKRIGIEAESDLRASNYDYILLFESETRAQVSAKRIERAREPLS
jgi:hypothetical protein